MAAHVSGETLTVLTLLHVVFAELGITRIPTVVLSQCYCGCLSGPNFPTRVSYVPVFPAQLWEGHLLSDSSILEQKDYSSAK